MIARLRAVGYGSQIRPANQGYCPIDLLLRGVHSCLFPAIEYSIFRNDNDSYYNRQVSIVQSSPHPLLVIPQLNQSAGHIHEKGSQGLHVAISSCTAFENSPKEKPPIPGVFLTNIQYQLLGNIRWNTLSRSISKCLNAASM
jgi:hypothetical protein